MDELQLILIRGDERKMEEIDIYRDCYLVKNL